MYYHVLEKIMERKEILESEAYMGVAWGIFSHFPSKCTTCSARATALGDMISDHSYFLSILLGWYLCGTSRGGHQHFVFST